MEGSGVVDSRAALVVVTAMVEEPLEGQGGSLEEVEW